MSVVHSPGPGVLGGQTPLPFNQLSSTPLAPTSPVYGMGMSSMHNRFQGTSYLRSPHYNMGYGSTNSPNYYSSSMRSRSPDYNSPANSSNRYGNSPNYTPTLHESNRQPFKDEEDA